MTEEEKYILEDLNYSFADGFSRGYNRGFLDGLQMRITIRDSEKIMDRLREEDNETR